MITDLPYMTLAIDRELYKQKSYMSCVMRKPDFAYAKTKAVTVKLISVLVFTTWIVQFLYYIYLKFQASNILLGLNRSVCVGPGRNS